MGLLLLGGELRADNLSVSAELEPLSGLVEGSLEWTVTNEDRLPLDHVELYLYPRFYSEDPDLDDILMPRVYPGRFSPGDQQLRCPLPTSELVIDGVPIAQLKLEEPLAPGESVTISCEFSTQVPHRYGTFGRTRRVVTLNGGLYPLPVDRRAPTESPGKEEPATIEWLHQAPPARMPQDLELKVPEDWTAVVSGRIQGEVERSLVPDALVPERSVSWLSVSVQRNLQRQNLPLSNGQSLTFVGQPLKRQQRRWIRRAAEVVHETLDAKGLPRAERGIVLVEAPLRRNLFELGDGVIYVSDRYLESSELLWRYYDVHLARALIADALQELVREREDPELLPLTLQGISWELVPDYLRRRWKNHVNLEQMLQRVRFLPAVDTLLETPVFPFADQIFDNPWVIDPIRADIQRFNRPLRSGRALFLKVQDIVGPRTVSSAAEAYVADPDPTAADFWTLLAERSGRELEPLARQWLSPPSRQNLSIESVERERDEDGFHVTRLTVKRELLEGEASDELVEVRVNSARPGRRGRVTLRWEGQESVASWEIRTAGRTGSVHVDPRGRVLEVDAEGIGLKQDNRKPEAIRVTGYAYFVALDLTGAGFQAYAALNFRPAHDTRHHVLTRVFSDTEVRLGGGLSYVHYFGPQRMGSYRRHRIVGSVDFDWLNPAFQATDAPFVLEGRASYIYEDRASSYFPTRGGRLQVTAFVGKDLALTEDHLRPLTESGYAGADLQAVGLVRLHPWHVLAFRGKVGIAGGNVAHRQFTLGGGSDLRGIPANHRLGKFRASGTAEWRHFFVRDADVQMLLSRLRGVQGSLFVETGFVVPELGELPQEQDAGVSIGYGLRLFGDWLGVLPAVGGIEIAWSPGAPDGRIPSTGPRESWPRIPFQIYLVGSQSF